MGGISRALLLALALARGAAGFDAHKMKKCEDNSFCRRHRAFAAEPGHSPEARGGAYAADASTFALDADGARVLVASALHKVPLELRVSALPGGLTARVRLRELHPLRPRFDPPHVLLEGAHATTALTVLRKEAAGVTLALGAGAGGGQLRLEFAPLRLRFFAPAAAGEEAGGLVEVATFNSRGLLEYEHYRDKPQGGQEAEADEKEEGAEGDRVAEEEGGAEEEEGAEEIAPKEAGDAEAEGGAEGEPAASQPGPLDGGLVWEESFQTHRDSRPFGPAAIGLDWSLPGFEHAYGLPERAAPFDLKDTR